MKKRVIILGGGFGGVYTAIRLERRLRRRQDVEIVLVSEQNHMVFQPMLAEVISGNIGPLDVVTPIRRLAPRTRLYVRDVETIDVAEKTVTLSPAFENVSTVLGYDHLVIALGNVTDFRKFPGLHDHALPLKNLGDALRLRDHLIHVLGEAAVTSDDALRRKLLTFVIAGGGFSGVEVCAEINDFVRRTARRYFHLDPEEIRVTLVHSHDRILDSEMPEHLGQYAQQLLARRGVEFIFNCRMQTATPEFAILEDGRRIPTTTLVSTVPSSPNPLLENLDVPLDHGRIKTDLNMRIEGFENAWAVGDCALIPNPSGTGYCPPTAQFAVRQATTCADNILAAIDGQAMTPFRFRELGKMASLGHRRAIARLFNRINLQGFVAWVFWRTAYWSKLPGWDRRIKVGASWFLDLICGPELVQTNLDASPNMVEQFYEPGEIVVRCDDVGSRLYVIISGRVEIYRDNSDGSCDVLAELGSGECFGVSEFLDNLPAQSNVRSVEPLTVTTYRRHELLPLLSNSEIRKGFERLR